MKGPDAKYIEKMFDNIAPDYDHLNHLLSLDIDKTWRKRAIRRVIDKSKAQRILDLACGTGDFSIEIARRANKESVVFGLDLSEGMLEVMEKKLKLAGMSDKVKIEQGNCEALTFDDDSFDVVTIGFGMRNVEHREKALGEILRVLKPGGHFAMLELSVPNNKAIRKLYELYFLNILPAIGGKISGDKAAYKYLPASVLKFPRKDEWLATMSDCGFEDVKHESYSMGICRLFLGRKSK